MTMDNVLVGVIVLAAVLYATRRVVRALAAARKPKAGCNDCGCSGDTPGS